MMDWADEIAEQLHNVMRLDSDDGTFSCERFAAALRKAKADGYKLGAEEWDDVGNHFTEERIALNARAIEDGRK